MYAAKVDGQEVLVWASNRAHALRIMRRGAKAGVVRNLRKVG